ncbi:MAG: bifunctional phosphoribosyl-AMP cyclohydrolase/phosphoribosyl-ATP diphosphatase HisIE [Haliscomenobacter sp.]|uniref:bifunctional phosphoribosyl-AMP cyclohydrolase/phosphoribosyl-ATP diphosphatase HisIE n=1 Tax=Haliscomenobacter sp. TaxID=2717303 RepID=UPI0029A6833A|nr:bifunctional phosphoribosyl-AMP cyclohydrolase/phosphoribosyl-ATP diphosphatase HisIE [Haliscomenobacter sp.]MDX2066988.1 bifunctional phosphoribosyl-AMP cyclohydrolase/phosphoribosyl-ATP diphosphatase HisIE [Haliscomenobacter sp.]
MPFNFDPNSVDFQKSGGLVPAIIQDHLSNKVLMMGYMNRAALDQTLVEGKVTFFSRSKERLWTKGESSNNFLNLVDIAVDCDQDTLLIKARPDGPTCHTGADTCWNEKNHSNDFLQQLENVIRQRRDQPDDNSYTTSLFKRGINKIAQKVGEEAVELVIEAKDNNADLFLNEAADLLFHYLILLSAKGYELGDVVKILESRHKK